MSLGGVREGNPPQVLGLEGLEVGHLHALRACWPRRISRGFSRAQGRDASRAQWRSPSRAQGRSPSRAQGRRPSRAQGGRLSRAQGGRLSRAQGRGPSRAQGLGPGPRKLDSNRNCVRYMYVVADKEVPMVSHRTPHAMFKKLVYFVKFLKMS